MEDELYHHGVKFQKWGIKNGPPYPLNRNKDGSISSNQKERKANYGKGGSSQSDYYKKEHAKALAERAAIGRFRKKEREYERKKKEQKEQKKEQKKLDKLKSDRDKALKGTELDKFYKSRDLFSDKEIDAFLERVSTEKKLKEALHQSRVDVIKRGVDYLSAIKPAIETLNSAYSLYSNIKSHGKKKENNNNNGDKKSGNSDNKKPGNQENSNNQQQTSKPNNNNSKPNNQNGQTSSKPSDSASNIVWKPTGFTSRIPEFDPDIPESLKKPKKKS